MFFLKSYYCLIHLHPYALYPHELGKSGLITEFDGTSPKVGHAAASDPIGGRSCSCGEPPQHPAEPRHGSDREPEGTAAAAGSEVRRRADAR
jgi:hypothetical protein